MTVTTFSVRLVELRVTIAAKGDQIGFVIVSRSAPKLPVMDFEILHGTANLASPAVSRDNFAMELTVCFEWESQSRRFWTDSCHEAFCCTSDRKAAFWGCGRNLKYRETECSKISGSSLSRFAPARKSAQIISRQ